MSVLDKVRKFKASRPVGGGGGRQRGIFHGWEDGDNLVRLIGEFIEVRTHFIAPAPARKDRGLCMPTAFQGDNKLSPVMNCLDWDVATEEPTGEHTCPICKLHTIAQAALKDSPDKEEKEFFDKLRQDASPRPSLKWNVIDRADPFILNVEGDNETKVPGLKIATVGMEAWKDIEGIFEQCDFDITDPEKGIDVKVTKGHNGMRVCYSAQAVIEGTSLLVTKLTDEEKAMKEHDLKLICGKTVDGQRVVDALHDDLRQIFDFNSENEAEAGDEPKVDEPAPKKGSATAKAQSKETPPADEKKAIDAAISEDDDPDALCGDGDSQKKS